MPHSTVLQSDPATHITSSQRLSTKERPLHFPYRLKELKELPRRLFRSPKACASQRVGRVRSFRLTPVYSVKLEDVLSGKHLPPLTLHDFESYLVHIERSPENLYFILWFNDYTKQYQEWDRSSVAPRHSNTLASSFMRAKQTFFTKSATLELNLDADTLAALSAADRFEHLSPSSLADVRHQVEGMLTDSLNNFVRSRSANAGRNRGLFAIFVGLIVMCIGLAPILSSVLESNSRWLRIAALPCFWFGGTTLICGLHGVCIIIFLFGDARQLTSYELARPQIQHHTLHYVNTLPQPHPRQAYSPSFSSRSADDPEVFESLDFDKARSCGVVDIAQFDVTPPKLHCDTGFSPLQDQLLHPPLYTPTSPEPDAHSPATIAPFLLTPPPENSGFNFDELVSSEPSMSRSPPVFGPLTRVLDRICIRNFWETVTRSAVLALVIAILLVMIAVAI